MSSHLRLWVMPTYTSKEGPFYDSHLETHFNKRGSITVERRVIPWNRAWGELTRAFKNGTAPDVFQVGNTWVSTMAQLGFLAEVPAGLGNDKTLATWLDKSVEFKGKKAGIPWQVEINILLARTDIMDEMNLTAADIADWDSFLKVCRRIGEQADANDPKRPYPYAFATRPEQATLHITTPWLLSAGLEFPGLTSPGVSLLSSDPVRVCMEYLNDIWNCNNFPSDNIDMRYDSNGEQFLNEGHYAFFMGYWGPVINNIFAKPINRINYKWPYKAVAFPAGPGGSIMRGGGSVLCVSSASRHPEAAWDLVQYLTSDDFMNDMVTFGTDLPAKDGLFWRQYDHIAEVASIKNMIKTSESYPSNPLWRSIEAILYKGVSQLLWHFIQGGKYDDRAVDIAKRFDDQINELIKYAWGM